MKLFRPLRLALWTIRQRAVFRSRSITLQIVSQMEAQNRVKFELHVAANPTTSINWKATLSLPSQNLRLKLKTAQVIKKKWIWKTSYQPTDPDFRKMRNPSSKKIFWTSEMSRSRLCLRRWSKNWQLRSTRKFSPACSTERTNFTEQPALRHLDSAPNPGRSHETNKPTSAANSCAYAALHFHITQDASSLQQSYIVFESTIILLTFSCTYLISKFKFILLSNYF